MEGLADGSVAGKEFFDHAFNLLAETGFIEIETEDIAAAVESLQRTPILIGLANLKGSHNGLKFGKHGIGRWLERSAVVLDALQIAGIACEGEGNQHKVAHIKTAGYILLDGLTEADGEFLRGVHGDALRGIGHEGIGQTTVDDGSDKLVRIEHAGIGDHGHGRPLV